MLSKHPYCRSPLTIHECRTSKLFKIPTTGIKRNVIISTCFLKIRSSDWKHSAMLWSYCSYIYGQIFLEVSINFFDILKGNEQKTKGTLVQMQLRYTSLIQADHRKQHID